MRRLSSATPRQRLGPGAAIVVIALGALGIGVGVTVRLWGNPGGLVVSANVQDSILYSWWVGHTPYAILAGENPFQTLDMNWPDGVSAMTNTTLLLPGLLLTPITLVSSSLVALNVLNALTVPACAAAGYWALRRVPWGRTPDAGGLSRPAALVGATAFAISPAIVNSLIGHASMAFAPGLVVLIALSVMAWHGPRPVRTGLLLGAVAAAQLFTGEEVMFQSVFGALVVMLVAAVSAPRAVPAAAARLARALAAAFAVFLPIAAYPLYLQFFGPLKQKGSPFLPDYFGADLTAFTTPTTRVWLHTSAAAEAATHFPGGVEEHLAYLGWPLLITCLLTAVVGWRRVPVRCAAAGLICAMAFSLGGRLWIAGTWTEHSGPFRLLQALPVADASLATRFGLLAALFAATLLAFAVHWISGRTARPVPGALLAAALSLACVAPLVPVPLRLTQAPAVPAYFTGAARELPPHSVVVVLPYPVGVDPLAMRWQSAAHYRFRMPGGYFIGPGEDGHAYMGGETDPPTARLLNRVARTRKPVVLTRIQRSDAVADFAAWGADSVVLGPNPAEAALRTTVSDLLGRQPVRVGGVDIWPMSHQ